VSSEYEEEMGVEMIRRLFGGRKTGLYIALEEGKFIVPIGF